MWVSRLTATTEKETNKTQTSFSQKKMKLASYAFLNLAFLFAFGRTPISFHTASLSLLLL